MTPRRIKNPPLPVLPNPGVRLSPFLITPLGENDSIRVVLRVNIGLVPTLDRRQPFQDRMVRLNVSLLKHARAMREELGSHEFNIFRRIKKTLRRAMYWRESSTSRDKIE